MVNLNRSQLENRIDMARGLVPCDLVLQNAKYLDVFTGTWHSGDVAIGEQTIIGVGEKYSGREKINLKGRFLVPGFIDSHVHIESTMMTPGEFEKAVLPRGTTSAIVDPHEIANVLGSQGLEYIINCAENSVMDLFVMLSSCVPATHLETSGAKLLAQDLVKYKNHPKVLGLAEMMNYPGLLNKDPEVLEKLVQFQDVPMDGHSPMLQGKDLNAYLSCGIKTCHESVSIDEAREKLEKGMQVLLREGSVAKNLRELVGILDSYSSPFVSFCTDDRNPLDIIQQGHLDYLIKLAIGKKIPPEVVYRSASLSTAMRYGLKNRGAIAPGYLADIVVLKNIRKCDVEKVFKNGRLVRERDLTGDKIQPPRENSMNFQVPKRDQIQLPLRRGSKVHVIGVIEGSLLTKKIQAKVSLDQSSNAQIDIKNDILKIVVKERYGHNQLPSVGFVKGMGLKKGAIGSSVGHDSHNVVVIGTNDEDILKCFETIKENAGGFAVVNNQEVKAVFPLPIAGLMTDAPMNTARKEMLKLRNQAMKIGCKLEDPFLQMAFLCLPVIPDLKITDKGLVDVNQFSLISPEIYEQA